ncbi:Predicted arabinose efflux permease, MFS family [Roseospirillum parvum]|uniref:Predicted arabinose efflux permease, MFS family n=1 Tax=Roseospirillum parvum TaxID=83401 RepID=A0A1G7ZJC2_9PROT|nr:Predicted arabinose efflux permease, MFS family [Roseospirillum parvum]
MGYLIGALTAPWAARRFGARRVVRLSLLAVLLSFACCAGPAPALWVSGWRLVAGVAGALLMVVAPSAVLAGLPAERRRFGSTLIFSSIGVGIVASALIVPPLVQWSLSAGWLAMSLLGLIPAYLCWRHLVPPETAAAPRQDVDRLIPPGHGLAFGAVLLAYGLDAVGFVPHTVFWVDYLAREAGQGAAAGVYWALFGVGGIVGPFAAGLAAQTVGWQRALVLALSVKALAVGLPLLVATPWGLGASSFLVGALVPGVVALVSGRLAEVVGLGPHRRAWGLATAGFALCQALAAYAMATLYVAAGSSLPLFAVAAGALALAVVVLLLAALADRLSA